jgi:hypothetical protein
MGILRFVGIVVMTSCYSPDARNWQTPTPADATHVSPSDASHDPPLSDATPVDATPIDAPPDAAWPIEIHVQVMGPGTVTLVGVGSCSKDCRLLAAYAQTATLVATPNDKQRFDRWTSLVCTGQPATCTFLALVPVSVDARFVKDD